MSLFVALALIAVTPPLELGVDAEDTFAARSERALGVTASAKTTVGGVSVNLATSLGRDAPLVGPTVPNHKLALSAGTTLELGPFAGTLTGIVEDAEPRLDASVAVSTFGAQLITEVEALTAAPQFRFVLVVPLDP